MSATHDAIIIGTGQAGPALAGRLAAAGMSTAIIERKLVGGTCVNTGCIPTKTLVASARAAHMARRAGEFGVDVGGPVSVDMARVKARMREITDASNAGVTKWLEGMQGVELIRGHARLTAPGAVEVDGRTLAAPRIFLDVGARAAIPPIEGLDAVDYLTNTSMLALDALPEHLVIVGGSYIGLEFAQMYRRFGAEVTVVQRGDRLIPREDPDVSQAVREIVEEEGVAVRLDAECVRVAPREGGISVGVDCAGGPPQIEGSHLLLATGRQPNTDDLGLDAAGVDTDERGHIVVDDGLQTTAPGIWALGEANGRGGFTHTAYDDFEIVAANLLDGGERRVSDRIPCYGLFIDPPLGRVGLTEAQARQSGRRVCVGRRRMSRVGRAREFSETRGFMKVVVDADSERLLGAAILGLNGDEAVHALIQAMYADRPVSALRRAVHIHPTVAELIPTVLGDLEPAD